jgi:dsDNA-specific endonuclease/ATPase MutS2
MTKKQKEKQDIKNAEFRKLYLKDDWDGYLAREHFINQHEPDVVAKFYGKPADDFFNTLRDITYAQNDLYFKITHDALVKENLIQKLQSINEDENIYVPDNYKKIEKYVQYQKSLAKEIIGKINNGEYPFQNPSSFR